MMNKRERFIVCGKITGLIVAGLLASSLECAAATQQVSSPDGKIVFKLNDENTLSYEVTWGGVPVLKRSELSFTVGSDNFCRDVTVAAGKAYAVDETFHWNGAKSRAENKCNGMEFPVTRKASGEMWTLDVRCYDDGFAFRYRLDKMKGAMTSDGSEFRFPAESVVWHTPSYEAPWDNRDVLSAMKLGTHMVFPITLELPGGRYAVINEADILGFTNSSMDMEADGAMRLRFHGPVPGQDGLKSGWRAVMLVNDLNAMVSSTLYANLCPAPDPKLFPNGSETEWIKPGRTMWQWWAYHDAGVEWDRQQWFVDCAAELQCKYYLVDEGWQNPQYGWFKDGKNEYEHLKELCAYAQDKGVGILVWASNPKDEKRFWPGTETREKADIFLGKVAAAGARGVKLDFIHGDDHKFMVWYKNILEVAAEHKLLVNFHGCNKPAGEPRTYPNELDREDVYGLEQYKAGRVLSGRHFTALPFTRYAAGHADMTETVLQRTLTKGTTLSQQLAQAVIYTSPLKCWADRPDVYLESNARDIISSMPTVWDETQVLPVSKIGECAAFARRSGNEWWIGIINGNNEEVALEVSLPFIGKEDWLATTFEDDFNLDFVDWKRSDSVVMDADGVIKIRMKPCGGYLARLNRFAPDAGGRFEGSRSVSVKGRAGNAYTYQVTPGMDAPASYDTAVNIDKTSRLDVLCVGGPDKGTKVSAWFVKVDAPTEPVVLPADDKITTKEVTVSLAAEFSNMKMYYTIDGSEPGEKSVLYSKPFTVKNGTTVKAASFLGGIMSKVVLKKYATPVPEILPKEGFIDSESVEVSMSVGLSGMNIFYTLDGREPGAKDERYSKPITVKSGTIVKAISIAEGVASEVAVKVYGKTVPAGPLPEVYLSDLTAKNVKNGWGDIKMNKSIEGNPLRIAGTQYDKGIGVHSLAEMTYDLLPEYKRFVATAGIDDEAGGSVDFVVEIDGVTAGASPVVLKGKVWNFDIKIPSGSRQMRLLVNDGGDGRGSDHADWVNCGFLK